MPRGYKLLSKTSIPRQNMFAPKTRNRRTTITEQQAFQDKTGALRAWWTGWQTHLFGQTRRVELLHWDPSGNVTSADLPLTAKRCHESNMPPT